MLTYKEFTKQYFISRSSIDRRIAALQIWFPETKFIDKSEKAFRLTDEAIKMVLDFDKIAAEKTSSLTVAETADLNSESNSADDSLDDSFGSDESITESLGKAENALQVLQTVALFEQGSDAVQNQKIDAETVELARVVSEIQTTSDQIQNRKRAFKVKANVRSEAAKALLATVQGIPSTIDGGGGIESLNSSKFGDLFAKYGIGNSPAPSSQKK